MEMRTQEKCAFIRIVYHSCGVYVHYNRKNSNATIMTDLQAVFQFNQALFDDTIQRLLASAN